MQTFIYCRIDTLELNSEYKCSFYILYLMLATYGPFLISYVSFIT